MHFKPKGPSFKKNLDQPEVPPIKINDFEIKEVDNTKFLGVTIDKELSWIPHLTTLAKKLRCCTGGPPRSFRLSTFLKLGMCIRVKNSYFMSFTN